MRVLNVRGAWRVNVEAYKDPPTSKTMQTAVNVQGTNEQAAALVRASYAGTFTGSSAAHVDAMCQCVQKLMQTQTLAGASERMRLKQELVQACEHLQREREKQDHTAKHKRPVAEGDDEESASTQWAPSKHHNGGFGEVHGMQDVIDTMHESLFLPREFPELFARLRIRPCFAMLLYGPPGTGKSMVARALASEQQINFFEASCAQVTSRWVGESEKLLRSLFAAVVAQAPSVLFLDEIDSIATSRETNKASSTADQRLLNQLLMEMDACQQRATTVFVLAATNLPWQLDPAILRRFPKRVHVGLPNSAAREAMLRNGIGHHAQLTEHEYADLVGLSEGFSGSDMANVMREALMRPLHKLLQATDITVTTEAAGSPSSDGDGSASEAEEVEVAQQVVLKNTTLREVCKTHAMSSIVLPPLTHFDVSVVIKNQKRTVSADLAARHLAYAADTPA
jgi:ATP-dependent Clp protease ATP-binding subunit ClpA